MPEKESRIAKTALVAALQREGLLPPRFKFRADEKASPPRFKYRGDDAIYRRGLWEHLASCRVSWDAARHVLGSGTAFLAVLDSAPSAFACRRIRPTPEVPILDITFLGLDRFDVVAYDHEELGPYHHRIAPANRPYELRTLLYSLLEELE